MNKWIIIVVLVAGGLWYYNGQQKKEAEQRAAAQAAEQAARSRVPTAEECRQIGGRIIEGMGCVQGAPDGPVNNGVSPEEMASVCQQNGMQYVRELNACTSPG